MIRAVICLSLCASVVVEAQSIRISNPSKCDFDNDQTLETVTRPSPGRLRVQLSSNSEVKRLDVRRSTRECRCGTRADGNGDVAEGKKKLICGRGGRQQTLQVLEPANKLLTVCNSLRELRWCEIWKTKQSDHFSADDPRKRSTALVVRLECSSSFPNPLEVFDNRGNKIHQLGQYFPPNAYRARFYGCYAAGDCKTPGQLVAITQNVAGTREVFLRESNGACVRVPDVGRCFNSSAC